MLEVVGNFFLLLLLQSMEYVQYGEDASGGA